MKKRGRCEKRIENDGDLHSAYKFIALAIIIAAIVLVVFVAIFLLINDMPIKSFHSEREKQF